MERNLLFYNINKVCLIVNTSFEGIPIEVTDILSHKMSHKLLSSTRIMAKCGRRFNSSWREIYSPPDMSKLVNGGWLQMNRDTREEINEYLDWRMEEPWKNLDLNEKKCAYYIAFGEWGPRAKKGSKEDQLEMNGPELILKALFSMTLFTALAFALPNYKKDKTLQDDLNKLRDIATD